MSKSDARVSAKHSGAISDDASNSEEDEDNRLALEEEQGRVPIFEEVVVPPEYETDEDRPIKGAEPPFDEMDTEDRKTLAERVEKQREEDQKKLMLNVLNGSSDDSDHDGFSVQNRQLVPQSDHPELEYADPAAHSMVYPPGSPPAYYSGSDEEDGANTRNTHPTISTYQPQGASPMSNLMMTSINLPITLQKMQKVAAEESDDEREEDDEDGKFYPGGAAPQMKRRMMQTNEDSMGDRKWLDALNTDEKMLIGYFDSFTPEEMILDTLYTYIPVEYLPAVGEPDPFIKIPRPDMIDDNTGLLFLDEPAVRQSDPVIVDMQMRTTVKNADKKHVEQEAVPMKNVERADKNKEEIDKWIENIKELHRSRPTMSVHYSRGMPDVEKLMQEWPDNVERKLKDLTLPTAELDVPLETFVDLVLNTVDIPVNKSRIESLHLLFSLYSEFKNSQHFRIGGTSEVAKPKADRLEL
uniref:Intraflagellar transport protein 46 homolog n=1 Tax=Pristionchus pacificus TaxID=54126 RepID=A0A8R1Z6X0_PRIPA